MLFYISPDDLLAWENYLYMCSIINDFDIHHQLHTFTAAKEFADNPTVNCQ